MANDTALPELPGQLPPPLSSSSQSPCSIFNSGRHFYLAVDRHQFKMETLVDLLGVVGRRPWLPIIICCSSRDDLDSVSVTLSNISYISLSYLYSDQSDAERASILNKFRKATVEWNYAFSRAQKLDGAEEHSQSHLIVVTDACLPAISSAEAPLQARVLINFEVPTKETYARRMSTCLAAGGIVISILVGGEVVALKSLEEGIGFSIKDMPIYISEIL